MQEEKKGGERGRELSKKSLAEVHLRPGWGGVGCVLWLSEVSS